LRVAFHAPLKPPHHPVPSGDRLMARQLMKVLERLGHTVDVASTLRTWRETPDTGELSALEAQAREEIDRLAAEWRRDGAPDLWFTYHNYYRAPDLIGPAMARRFAIPYVVAEGSYAKKRDRDGWAGHQALALIGLRQANLHLCFTARDISGLADVAPRERLLDFPPFLELEGNTATSRSAHVGPVRLVTIGMARPGKKLENFRQLAAALGRIADAPWRLDAIGGGAALAEARAAFGVLGEDRITFHGEQPRARVLDLIATADLYVWPGFEEAYGLSYLEAQAHGVPVVARNEGGVSAVVRHGETGLLTPPGDMDAFAAAIRALIEDAPRRRRMGEAARRFVQSERTLESAVQRLAGPLAALESAGVK
jgi:glycosyltransferase involved in cell wall biosynthesis